ncbi:MAG: CCA tRNA nucleotidyltransferase [Acidobacteria bacterium]|nr:CCA tRNA nucleotidyltransferase [Acidobacteriota bacterium]
MKPARFHLLSGIRDRRSRRVLRLAREESPDPTARVYLVGGCVRDLALGVGLRDIDLVVTGDAGAFAARLASRLGVRASAPTRFGTSRIVAPGCPQIDIAMARAETYARPAALPDVEAAPIEVDLARRDFTMNAMAIPLTGPDAGGLLDPFGGLSDLTTGRLRLLHPASLVDDPTRAFRGARYAARLGLRPDSSLRRALRSPSARRALSRLGAERLAREIARVWLERDPGAVFARLSTWGLLTALHPRLRWRGRLSRSIRHGERLRKASVVAESSEFMLALAASSLGVRDRAKLLDRLALAGRTRRVLLAAAAAPARASRMRGAYRDAAEVAGWSPLALLTTTAAASPSAAARVRALGRSWREATPRLCAEDILAEGIPEGPRVGRILERLRRERFEGRIRTARDERRRIQRRS